MKRLLLLALTCFYLPVSMATIVGYRVENATPGPIMVGTNVEAVQSLGEGSFTVNSLAIAPLNLALVAYLDAGEVKPISAALAYALLSPNSIFVLKSPSNASHEMAPVRNMNMNLSFYKTSDVVCLNAAGIPGIMQTVTELSTDAQDNVLIFIFSNDLDLTVCWIADDVLSAMNADETKTYESKTQ